MNSDRPVVGVGAIVVDDGALLMVKRGLAPAAGLWSIPGGRVEPGERLADAVTREVAEETGLEVVAGPLAGIHEVLGPPHYVVLDFHAALRRRATPAAGGDAADARWVPLDSIQDLECTPRLLETLTSWGVVAGAPSAEE
jgi:8-oxo-dGTP diphosphatase